MQRVTAKNTLDHNFFMSLALKAAASVNAVDVHPNPMVGAVIVSNNKVISTGAHLQFGQAHAEVNAIKKLKQIPSDAILYVTLEPCCFTGKTPPCVEAILRSGIQHVVVAMKDPNPKVAGKGIEMLKKANVRVESGILEENAQSLNRAFSYWIKKQIPYVTIKAAQSLDGCIATKSGQSQWISSEASRTYAQSIRKFSDAVLVGVDTVLADDPKLTIRGGNIKKQPLTVVLDSTLRTPLNAQIFAQKNQDQVILFTSQKALQTRGKKYLNKAKLIAVRQTKNGRLLWADILKNLGQLGVAHLLVEGGGEVIADALASKVVNEAYFFIAPIIVGGKSAIRSVGGEGVLKLKDAYRFKNWSTRMLGDDLLFRGEF